MKHTQKNRSELGDIYSSVICKSISFYRQHLKITCKFCTSVHLEITGISQGTLHPLILKTSSNVTCGYP